MPDLQSELSKLARVWDSHEQSIRQPQTTTPANPSQPKETEMANTASASTTPATTAPATTAHAARVPIIVTGILSRDIHAHLLNNPSTYVEVTEAMASVGYKKNSAQSILTQMSRAGLVTIEPVTNILRLVHKEYKPVTNPYKANPVGAYSRKAKTIKPRTVKPREDKAAGLAALKADTAPKAAPPTTTTTATPAPSLAHPARLVRLQTAADVLNNMSVSEAHKLYVELCKLFGGK